MTGVVVDTDVFSFIFKGDDRALAYRPHVDGKLVGLSFMTVAELYRWALIRNWGDAKLAVLQQRIEACEVIEPDNGTHWHWARLMSVKGRPMNSADAWIAATAMNCGVPLVTHNAAHFANIEGLTVITEPSSPA